MAALSDYFVHALKTVVSITVPPNTAWRNERTIPHALTFWDSAVAGAKPSLTSFTLKPFVRELPGEKGGQPRDVIMFHITGAVSNVPDVGEGETFKASTPELTFGFSDGSSQHVKAADYFTPKGGHLGKPAIPVPTYGDEGIAPSCG